MIGQAVWDRYKAIINAVHDDFNQDTVTWQRSSTTTVSLFQEEESPSITEIPLKVLASYNYFRTWPITRHSDSGELDGQNMVILINREYLNGLGYLTAEGYFNFQPDKDYFIHRGIKYKSEGDTLLSQAKDTPLLVQLILRREEVPTGTDRYNQ